METETAESNTIDILLVEDDESHAHLIRRVFESSTVAVKFRHARDIKTMLSELKRRRPQFLILDYLLPDGRGIDAISAGIRRLNIPTVVITSFADDDLIAESRSIGACGLVAKSAQGFRDLPQIVSSQF